MPDFKIKITIDNATAKTMAQAQADALRQVSVAAKQAGDAGDDMGRRGASGMTGFAVATGVAMVAAQKLLQVMQAVGQATKDASDKQKEYARTFMSERDQLRELATLQGKEVGPGFTTAFAQFRTQTGMRTPEAIAFQTALFNRGSQFTGPGQHVSDAHAAVFMRAAGAMAVARGMSPKDVGDIAGSIMGARDWEKEYGEKAPEMMLGQLSRVVQGVQKGSGGNAQMLTAVSSLISQFVNADNPLEGTFKSIDDIVATASTMAESKPEEAEVYTRALLRFSRDFQDKKKGPFLEAAGITEQTEQMEAFQRIGQQFRKEAAETGRKVNDVVADYVPNDIREQVALRTLANRGVGPRGVIAQRKQFMAQFTGPGEEANTAAFQADPARGGLQRIREAQTAESITGRGAEMADITTLREEALARMIARKEIDTTATNLGQYLAQGLTAGILADQRTADIDAEVGKILARRAEQRGVAPIDWHNWMPATAEARAEFFNADIARLRGAGVDPLGGKEAVQHLKAIRDQGANAPLPAPPAAGAVRAP